MGTLNIIQIDYKNAQQMSDLIELLNAYACDEMGGAEPLSQATINDLSQQLIACPTALSLVAYSDGEPAGLLNAFWSVSTFAAKPLMNIHDLAVKPEFRGQRIATALMLELEVIAKAKGCCKLTLEVLSNNQKAQQTYLRFGFAGYQLNPDAGHALFWQKKL